MYYIVKVWETNDLQMIVDFYCFLYSYKRGGSLMAKFEVR